MQIPNNFLEIYKNNYSKIHKCSQEIVKNIDILLKERGIKHINQITGRAKSIDRFKLKAEKKTNDGIFKYEKPLSEIQDQIGIRVVAFYLSDVEKIAKIIFDNYEHIEAVDKHPENYDAFSYVGKHFIIFVPDEVRTWGEDEYMPSFFELQIKTMFQHAWAESEHDLSYKTKNELSDEDKRLIAFSAAQAWGADHVFEHLSEKYIY